MCVWFSAMIMPPYDDRDDIDYPHSLHHNYILLLIINNKNHIIYRREVGLKWEYLPGKAAVLLDKIYKDHRTTYELGGEAALRLLNDQGVYAVHTTCYEQKTKVMGLKVCKTKISLCFVLSKCVVAILFCVIYILSHPFFFYRLQMHSGIHCTIKLSAVL